MTIKFQTESGLQEKSYKGKFKKNYYEIYVDKMIAPIPFLYFGWYIERVRIGLNENRDLLIQYKQENFGWILFMMSGNFEDEECTFKRIDD